MKNREEYNDTFIRQQTLDRVYKNIESLENFLNIEHCKSTDTCYECPTYKTCAALNSIYVSFSNFKKAIREELPHD